MMSAFVRPFRNAVMLSLFVSGMSAIAVHSSHASERTPIPVPKNIVYAGQAISGQLLRDRSVPTGYLSRVSVFTRHSDVVGKVAKTTLMPGRPIPVNYVTEPDVVKVNQRALMRYEISGLKITAEVSPLNSAQVGGQVRARNLQTGIIVYGTAQKDGTIVAGAIQ